MQIPAWVVYAAMAASTVATVVSSQNQAKAQENAAEYDAQVAENNAKSTRDQAGAREEMMRRNMRIQMGKARAGMAQSGLDIGSGSMLDVYDQSAIGYELDALNTRWEGEMGARGLMAQADNMRTQGKNQAANTRMSGWMGAGQSLLSGISSYGRSAAVKQG